MGEVTVAELLDEFALAMRACLRAVLEEGDREEISQLCAMTRRVATITERELLRRR